MTKLYIICYMVATILSSQAQTIEPHILVAETESAVVTYIGADGTDVDMADLFSP